MASYLTPWVKECGGGNIGSIYWASRTAAKQGQALLSASSAVVMDDSAGGFDSAAIIADTAGNRLIANVGSTFYVTFITQGYVAVNNVDLEFAFYVNGLIRGYALPVLTAGKGEGFVVNISGHVGLDLGDYVDVRVKTNKNVSMVLRSGHLKAERS